MSLNWNAGDQPWLRRHQPEAGYGSAPDPVQCMFCGGKTLKRSATDHPKDPGRLELYCDNELCDAREMVLLVVRDGARAHLRSDVRALRLIDSGELDIYKAVPPELKSIDIFDQMEDEGTEVARRMRTSADDD